MKVFTINKNNVKNSHADGYEKFSWIPPCILLLALAAFKITTRALLAACLFPPFVRKRYQQTKYSIVL
jgi:hypothetical protein